MNSMFSKAAIWLVIALVLFTVFKQFDTRQARGADMPYSQFMVEAREGRIDAVVVDGRTLRVRAKDGRHLVVYTPSDIWMVGDLMKYGVQVNAKPEEEQSMLLNIFVSWFPMLLLIGVWVFFMNRMQGGGRGGSRALQLSLPGAELTGRRTCKAVGRSVGGIRGADDDRADGVEAGRRRPMTNVRYGICFFSLIALLAAACSPAFSVGVVEVHVKAVDPVTGDTVSVVCKDCQVKLIATASDCDERDSTCCPDRLTFDPWPIGSPPTRQGDGTYYGEEIITCDWTDRQSFTFGADDEDACTGCEDDDPGKCTLTLTGVEVTEIIGPEFVCPGEWAYFWAKTIPEHHGALLKWSGGGEPAEGSGIDFQTRWNTPGMHTVTVKCGEQSKTFTTEVYSPVHEVTFLEPVGTVGGKTPIRIEVKTRCASTSHSNMRITWRKASGGEETQLLPVWRKSRSVEDDQGIVTEVYGAGPWDTTHYLLNDAYIINAHVDFFVEPGISTEVVVEQEVNVKNLSIDSASPEGIIVWKGEEGETATVSVTLDDNDVNDPVTLTLKLWPTDMPKLYPSTPDCYDSIVLEDVSGASHTFTWDGNGGMAPPGTYTYDVEAVQTDIYDTDPTLQITDSAKYRSQHLSIWRARDEETGLPIYDVRYDGYDDKGTEGDESDDEYIYVVRHYVLTDSHQWDASGGQIWLYGPELTRLGSWDIGGLPCTLHDSCDGLSPGYHAVRIGVRTSLMDDEGTYRFVAHVKDAHGQHYRNGQDR